MAGPSRRGLGVPDPGSPRPDAMRPADGGAGVPAQPPARRIVWSARPTRLALLRVGTALGLLAVAHFFTACTNDLSRHIKENWVINGVPVSQFTDPPPSVKRAIVRKRAAERKAARAKQARAFPCGQASASARELNVVRSDVTRGPVSPTPHPEAMLPSYSWLTVEVPPEPTPTEQALSEPPTAGWTFTIVPCRPAAPPAAVKLTAEPHAAANGSPQ